MLEVALPGVLETGIDLTLEGSRIVIRARDVTVDLVTAVLGGKAEMTIPPGTQPGQHFRLAGQGLFDGVRRGDLIVTVQVQIPRSLSDEERRLFEQLRSARP